MKLLALTLAVIVLATGCTVNMTNEGMNVRQINADAASPCKFIGVVQGSESFAWTKSGDRRNALNKVRNQVAYMGGNSYVLTQTNTDGFGSNTQADAYICR